MGSAVNDDRDQRFYGNAGDDRAKRLKVVQQGMRRHIQLNPDVAYLFCEHGTYVGANGVLKHLLCEFCIEELDTP